MVVNCFQLLTQLVMDNMKAVTTFSKQNYDDYARKLLESAKLWPDTLIAYVEEPLKDYENVEYRDFWGIELPGKVKIADYLKEIKKMGLDGGDPYDYNKDVYKFCRKVFVQYDFLKNLKERAFWLDADIQIKKPIQIDFLNSLFDGWPICYLGRNGFYSECSFVGFDMSKKEMVQFLADYTSLFTTGVITNLKWWHDCAAFDFARQKHSYFGSNLSKFYEPGRGLHVFPDSVLGEYMTHNKGQRKYR